MKSQIVIHKRASLCHWTVRRDTSDPVEEYMNDLGDGTHFVGVQPFPVAELEAAVAAYAEAKASRVGMYEAQAKATTELAMAMRQRYPKYP